MPETQPTEIQEIHSLDEIPDFKSENEKAEFWATHCLKDELLEQMEPVPEGMLPPPRSERESALAPD